MLRPSKRAHEQYVAAKEHVEAQQNLQDVVRERVQYLARAQNPTAKALVESGMRAELESARQRAEAAYTALAEAEVLEDLYICPKCGNEFPNGPHTELLVVAVIDFDNDGRAFPERIDFGMSEVVNNNMGRRIKFCGPCHSEFAIPLREYVNMR